MYIVLVKCLVYVSNRTAARQEYLIHIVQVVI